MTEVKDLSVLQVYIDESGGGPANVALLREAISSDAEWHELPLEPRLIRRTSIGRWRALSEIRKKILESQADIVHSHGVRAAAEVAAVRPDAKLVMTVHGMHAVRRNRGVRQAVASFASRRVLKRMDVVLCTGLADLALVREWGVDRSSDVRWIHSAFEPPRERDREEAREALDLAAAGDVVLWMGRFEAQKNPQLLIEAISRLRRDDVVVLMAGDGPLRESCSRFLRHKGVADRVRMPGWLDDPSWAYAASDVYVSTARWEGFPLTGLEAAAAGLPLVLTDSSGNRDLVEVGLDAVLVAADPDEIAEALDGALKASRPGLASRRDVLSSFSVPTLRAEVLAAYRAVLGQA